MTCTRCAIIDFPSFTNSANAPYRLHLLSGKYGAAKLRIGQSALLRTFPRTPAPRSGPPYSRSRGGRRDGLPFVRVAGYTGCAVLCLVRDRAGGRLPRLRRVGEWAVLLVVRLVADGRRI